MHRRILVGVWLQKPAILYLLFSIFENSDRTLKNRTCKNDIYENRMYLVHTEIRKQLLMHVIRI